MFDNGLLLLEGIDYLLVVGNLSALFVYLIIQIDIWYGQNKHQ